MEKSVNYNNYCWVQRKTSSSALKEKHETTSSPKCSIAKNSMRLVRGCVTCVNHKAVTRLGAALPSHSPESPADCRSITSCLVRCMWVSSPSQCLRHSRAEAACSRAGQLMLAPPTALPTPERGGGSHWAVSKWVAFSGSVSLFLSTQQRYIYAEWKKKPTRVFLKPTGEKKMASLHVTL